jgi:hypothetical protein
MTEERNIRCILMAMTGGDSRELIKVGVRSRALLPYMNNDPIRTLAAIFDLEMAERQLPRLFGNRRSNTDPRRDAVLFTTWYQASPRKRRAEVKKKLGERLGREPTEPDVTAAMQRMQTLARKHGLQHAAPNTRTKTTRKAAP